jgi:hypothetical protein
MYSQYTVCDSVLKDLARIHWDGINPYCKSSVINGWKSGGCYETIQKKLGYRIRMLSASLQDAVRPGYQFSGTVSLVNTGWGKIYNYYGCDLVFRNKTTKSTFSVKTAIDPRRFCMNDSAVTVPLQALIPSNVPAGSYSVYLHIHDTAKSIATRPEYAIRFANKNVWEDSTGYNSLLHTLMIDPTARAAASQSYDRLRNNSRKISITRKGASIECDVPGFNVSKLTFEIFSLAGEMLSRSVVTENASGRYTISHPAIQKMQSMGVLRIKGNGLEIGTFLLKIK